MPAALKPRGRAVGIDPSISGTGIAILGCVPEVHGAPKARPDTGEGAREWLHSVERAQWLAGWVCARTLPGDLVAIEGYGYGGPGLAVLVELGALIRARLLDRGVRFIDVAPAALKKFACGKGNAKKDEVRLAVYKRWGFEHASNDAVDAYALAKVAEAVMTKKCETDAQRAVVAALLKSNGGAGGEAR